MNKYIILLLAVCLVSVSAFVKRDAPTAAEPTDLLADTKKTIENGFKKIAENFNTETIKKGLEDAISNFNKAIDGLKPTEAPKA